MVKIATSLTPQTCAKVLVHAYSVAQYVAKMMMVVDAAPAELHQKLVQCTTLTHMITHPTITGHIAT